MGKARKSASKATGASEAAARGAAGACPVYAVYGPDDSLRSRELQELLKQMEAEGASITQLPGSPMPELAEVLDELRTMPLLGDRRVMVVRSADGFVSKYRKQLESYIEAPSTTGTLVLDVKVWPKTTRLFKQVEQAGRNIACEPPRRGTLPTWCAQHALTLGKRLDPSAAQLLCDLVGDEQPAALLGEIEKLATYVNDRPAIRVEDVQALVSPLRGETIFAVVDAVADRNAAAAVSYWEQVIATDRQAEFRAVGGLAWGLRRLLRARTAYEASRSFETAIREGKLWGDSRVLAARIGAFTSRQLGMMLAELARIDLSTKTGGDLRTEVENLLVAACHAPRRAR